MSILKSPLLAAQRVSLGQACSPGKEMTEEQNRRSVLETLWRQDFIADLEKKIKTAKEEACAEGYKEGFRLGHEEGRDAAIETFFKKQALLDQVLERVEQQVDAWLQSVASEAVDLAMDAFVRILGENVISPTVIEGMINQVCAPLRDSDILKIRMHPVESQVLISAFRQSKTISSARERLCTKIEEDPELHAGGIIVETPRGEYRATLDIQVKRLLQMLEAQRITVIGGQPREII